MEYILVTVNCGETEVDLKVPALIPVGQLIGAFSEIHGTGGQTLHAEPKGIILDKNKTLAVQGVGHGAKLTLS